jgi:hypothetical protein
LRGKGDAYEYNMTYPNNLSIPAKLGYIQPRMKDCVSNKKNINVVQPIKSGHLIEKVQKKCCNLSIMKRMKVGHTSPLITKKLTLA